MRLGRIFDRRDWALGIVPRIGLVRSATASGFGFSPVDPVRMINTAPGDAPEIAVVKRQGESHEATT